MSNEPQSVFAGEADQEITRRINALLQSKERVILAIDGNCCAGKTTMASRLGLLLGANVFHLDDYFLQPHMRTPERLSQPGGNVDAERFLEEVLLPAARGETAHVRKYDCQEDLLLEPVAVSSSRVAIVEGAYSLHPLLAPQYDLKVFCRIAPELQLSRIRARNGAAALKMFQSRWIPLENNYFQALDVLSQCDIVIDAKQTK
jgi:uridine kinase